MDCYVCSSQVETLRKQDTSLQLSRTREELSASVEKSGELESQLEESRSREDTLRSQLRQAEQKWREVRTDHAIPAVFQPSTMLVPICSI